MEREFFKSNLIHKLRKTLICSLLIILTIQDKIQTQNLCNLKIAESMMSSFNGNDIIYNFGKIDETRFGKNAATPYTAPLTKEIDYFYVTEIHGVEIKNAHEGINFSIKSSNEAISKPVVKINKSLSKIEEKTNIEAWTIEVVYNCVKNNPGTIDITLNVSPDHCLPFDLNWKKTCKESSK